VRVSKQTVRVHVRVHVHSVSNETGAEHLPERILSMRAEEYLLLRAVHRLVATPGHEDSVTPGEVAIVTGRTAPRAGQVLSDLSRDGHLTKQMSSNDGTRYAFTPSGVAALVEADV
jgi:hypothetical protein